MYTGIQKMRIVNEDVYKNINSLYFFMNRCLINKYIYYIYNVFFYFEKE